MVFLAEDTSAFTLGMYVEQAVRHMYLAARHEADTLAAGYADAYSLQHRRLVDELSTAAHGFRPPALTSPLVQRLMERQDDQSADARPRRADYVAKWLLGHPELDDVLAAALWIHSFGLKPRQVARMRRPLAALMERELGFPADQALGFIDGSHIARNVLKDRIRGSALAQQRRIALGAKLFVLRYVHPGQERHPTWETVLNLAENGTATRTTIVNASPFDVKEMNDPEAVNIVRPFVRAFPPHVEP